jgi:hypothetical protein
MRERIDPMSQNYDEFRRSLDELVQQAQRTAQLGLDIAKEGVETLVQNRGPLNEQVEEVRSNLQTMAREMETRAQELVHMATAAMQNGPLAGRTGGSSTPGSSASAASPAPEAPSANESATAAGAGTPQDASGSAQGDSTPTPSGEAPKQ